MVQLGIYDDVSMAPANSSRLNSTRTGTFSDINADTGNKKNTREYNKTPVEAMNWKDVESLPTEWPTEKETEATMESPQK